MGEAGRRGGGACVVVGGGGGRGVWGRGAGEVFGVGRALVRELRAEQRLDADGTFEEGEDAGVGGADDEHAPGVGDFHGFCVGGRHCCCYCFGWFQRVVFGVHMLEV